MIFNMNKYHQRRLWIIAFFSIGAAITCALMLYALKQNINVFLTPSELIQKTQPGLPPLSQNNIRLGGMVKVGSIIRDKTGLGVRFVVTDLKQEVPVYYVGVLPDLFREGKGVIAEGRLSNANSSQAARTFNAQTVLAKHDENYMPQKVHDSLKQPPA